MKHRKTILAKCSICCEPLNDMGHNAWPINNGRCCDRCNNLVIAKRLSDMMGHEAKTIKGIRKSSLSVIALLMLFWSASHVEAKTLEQVNRDINAYWAEQRYESNQRLEEYRQEQELKTLREIEQNTEDCKCE